jgi:hypothetical protein
VKLAFLSKLNLSSVRRDKSSQGSRRGTCGWITSFFIFYNLHFTFLQFLFLYGPVAQPGRAPPLQGGGLGFESRRVHRSSKFIIIFIILFLVYFDKIILYLEEICSHFILMIPYINNQINYILYFLYSLRFNYAFRWIAWLKKR